MKLDLSKINFEDLVSDDGDNTGINIPNQLMFKFSDRILIFNCVFDGPTADWELVDKYVKLRVEMIKR